MRRKQDCMSAIFVIVVPFICVMYALRSSLRQRGIRIDEVPDLQSINFGRLRSGQLTMFNPKKAWESVALMLILRDV